MKYKRWEGPRVNATVDILPYYVDEGQVYQLILGRKRTDPEGKYRFIGGFSDPIDNSFVEAAIRECGEETSNTVLLTPKDLDYVGSARVEDPRLANGPDSILTSVYLAELLDFDRDSLRAGDDLIEVRSFPEWVNFDNLLVPHHLKIFKNLVMPKMRELLGWKFWTDGN